MSQDPWVKNIWWKNMGSVWIPCFCLYFLKTVFHIPNTTVNVYFQNNSKNTIFKHNWKNLWKTKCNSTKTSWDLLQFTVLFRSQNQKATLLSTFSGLAWHHSLTSFCIVSVFDHKKGKDNHTILYKHPPCYWHTKLLTAKHSKLYRIYQAID